MSRSPCAGKARQKSVRYSQNFIVRSIGCFARVIRIIPIEGELRVLHCGVNRVVQRLDFVVTAGGALKSLVELGHIAGFDDYVELTQVRWSETELAPCYSEAFEQALLLQVA